MIFNFDKSNYYRNLYSRFHNFRIPRENLLNSVADVSSDGRYISSIQDPDQVTILSCQRI